MEDRPKPPCCGTPDPRIARRFDARAGRWTDGSTLPPMVDVSARLLDSLRDAASIHPTVLELGCGTGALSVALLELGATRATGFDLSPTSLDVARRRAAAAAVDDRATFILGDASASPLEAADWVILDRSLCCFAHDDQLVAAATSVARGRIALSVPESRGWRGIVNRVLWGAENLWDGLRGGCRGYVHDLRGIEDRLAHAGFHRVAARSGDHGLWFIGLYECHGGGRSCQNRVL
jgi:SAM-dependent methyltransferase